LAVRDRGGAGIAPARDPAQQLQEERQVVGLNPALIDRQEIAPRLGRQQEVGILHAFGHALEAQGRAQVEVGQQTAELLVGDVGVDRHGPAMGEVARTVKSTSTYYVCYNLKREFEGPDMITLKLSQVGNSVGVLLPKEALL